MAENTTTYIYFLYDPTWKSKKFYVGKTDDPNERIRDHLALRDLEDNNKKDNWINSLLRKGITVQMQFICEVPDYMTWQQAERQWIAFIKWCGVYLTNGTKGGDGANHLTDETKRRISKTLTGRKNGPHTEAWKQKISVGNRKGTKTKSGTGFKGVYLVKKKGTYIAQVTLNNRHHTIGYYDTKNEAAMAYDVVTRRLYGSAATFNFPFPGELSARPGITPQNWQLPDVYVSMPNEKNGVRNGRSAAGKRKKSRCKNKVGFKGVRVSGNRYIVYISRHGKHRYIGTYQTVIEAALAYDIASRMVYGPDASFNFPYVGEVSGRHGVDPQNWIGLPYVDDATISYRLKKMGLL